MLATARGMEAEAASPPKTAGRRLLLESSRGRRSLVYERRDWLLKRSDINPMWRGEMYLSGRSSR